MILRIQDKAGRGPWRPGFSDAWVDAWRTQQNPPIYVEVSNFREIVADAHKRGKHIGCAAKGMDGLLSWFSPMEIVRLHGMGFYVADASGCDVLAETPTQVLICSNTPLKNLPNAVVAR